LRTPLNAVIGFARLLQREPDLGERQADGLATIEQSGEHLLDLINDLLDLAKVEAGRLDLAPLPLKLAAFLPAVVHVVQVKGDEKGLPVIWEASPGLPSTVLADERRLRQILLNLLGNAVKFTDRGEVRLRVHLLAREEDVVRLRFEVIDTGVGVAADELKNIFKRFEQAGELARRASGTGLGLAISQQLVRLMGSEIQVDSTPGAGSRFWFDLSLPVLAAEPGGPREEATVRGYAGPRRTVLVVDDVSANRAVLAVLLRELGFTVVEADNGQAALEQVRQATPDLVVMDLVMPVMDGLAAIRNIRGIAALPRLPIVAVSASTDREGQEISRAAGADAFLAKPIDHEALLHRIGGLLGLSWLREESEAAAEMRVAEPLSVPPREEMEVLHRLALAGDMRAIRRQAEHLAGRDGRYRPFAEHLDQLAKQYQSKAVLQWIERCLERSS
jgi:CheY-like chemotaxis protein